MSKLLYVVYKEKQIGAEDLDRLEKICSSLNPDNIVSKPNLILNNGGIGVGIMNPSRNLKYSDVNVFFGQGFGQVENWEIVGESHPDGNYALFRSNNEKVEIISDVLGTRAVWYYYSDTVFIASTSQRAIVKFLGDFEFNEKVLPWMLCNGLLGPGHSWDKRLKLLSPNSSLVLKRDEWKYQINSKDIHFKPNDFSDQENISSLKNTLKYTFENIKLDFSQWKLSLSGGYDSRANLCLLPKTDDNGKELNTITWGIPDSYKITGTDAYVAQKLANYFKLKHKYTSTENSNEDLKSILNRFLSNGEGRIDHIGGYMDGFNIWKNLFDSNIEGVIRGDEIFGSYDFVSEFHLKSFVGISLPDDYVNLNQDIFSKTSQQQVPEKYLRKNGETKEQWRDRIYQSYYVPFCLAALSDLKSPYVEQVNPLLSREIVKIVRELPDHLRTDKKAFKSIVDSISPKIQYAHKSSTDKVKNLMKNKSMVEIIKKELDSEICRSNFNSKFLSNLKEELKITDENNGMFKNVLADIKSLLPKKFKRKMIKSTFVPKIDMNTVGFRIFIISSMVRILKEDALFLENRGQQ